jgi:hypothetical protein
MSEGKHVVVWAGVTSTGPSSRWFQKMYSSRAWLEDRLQDEGAQVVRTDKFSEAYVFDSFEEAYKVFDCPAVKKVIGGRLFIRYYSDKEYFKEKLRRD